MSVGVFASHNGDSATLYAVWKINTYTVTITLAGSGLSRSTSSVSITYGKTGTVTITPSAGYYLYAKSCTNGYTVNGSTGTGATGAQTITISNNSKAANSTCTFTGAALTAAQACAKITSTHGTYYAGSYLMIKLKDGKCWTKNTVATATWANAASACSTRGMTLPTAAQAKNLVQQYGGTFIYNTEYTGSPYGIMVDGTGNTLANYIANSPHWTSTSYDSTHAWFLTLYAGHSSYPMVKNGYGDSVDYPKTKSNGILCIGA